MRFLLTVAAGLTVAVVLTAHSPQSPFLGKWNMQGTGDDSTRVYWLEVTEEDGQLHVLFLNRGGHPRPMEDAALEGDELVWSDRQFRFRARRQGDQLVGTEVYPMRGRRGGGGGGDAQPTERTVNWVGVRPPTWPPANANGDHTYGAPVELFDGTFDAFGVQFPNRDMGWSVVDDGSMNNGDGANNLVSKQKFTDFKVEAEYRLAEGSNSGIYLRGRYELQVLDDYGDPTFDRGHLSIYGRVAPTANATRPTGEWQQMEAIIVGNRVTVTLNGQRIHDNVVVGGITGGALDAAETEPGPVMIQGDHSGVWFRKLVVTPITAAGR